jgi:hypothetical protein
MKADPNFDCKIDALDVIFVVNIVLELTKPTDDEIWRSDCNGPHGSCDEDGKIQILDALKIVNIILKLDRCP